MHINICMCVYRAGYKKRKEISNFLLSRHNCDTLGKSDLQSQIIIPNLFAFLHPPHKICLKQGNFVSERGKKGFFGEPISKVICNQPKVIHSAKKIWRIT